METNYFSELYGINVSDHVEKKGQFSYLSWAYAVKELKSRHPDATWFVTRYGNESLPYQKTELGYFVEVSVTVSGITHSQIHPVLDGRNKPIASPTPFDINTSIQRALVKAIALHGLGLYIYAGEDLPEGPQKMDPEEVDQSKVSKAVSWFKQKIDEDAPEVSHQAVKDAWGRLSNNERLAVEDQLRDKAPDSNKMYKNLLKDYLNHSEAA